MAEGSEKSKEFAAVAAVEESEISKEPAGAEDEIAETKVSKRAMSQIQGCRRPWWRRTRTAIRTFGNPKLRFWR